MTGSPINPNVCEAAYLLNKATTEFLERHGSKLAPGEEVPSAAVPEEFLNQLIVWMAAVDDAATLDRRDLEEIFSIAESAAESDAVLEAISDAWDILDKKLPEPDTDEFYGSIAEITGDYSRIHFAKKKTVR